jgi:HK97 gp10 family phage protein
MQLSVETAGFTELMQTMRQLPQELQRSILKDAVSDSAQVVYTAVKAETPTAKDDIDKNEMHWAGYMKAALYQSAARKRSDGSFASSVLFDTKKFPGLITVTKAGKRYFYPAAIEYGTAHIAPRSFMRRAFDAVKEMVFARFVRVVMERIESFFAAKVAP